MSVAAIVPAAGSGMRLGSPINKALLPLRGRPMLAHTLRVLQEHPAIRWIILVVRAEDRRAVRTLLTRERITKALPPREGGASRAASVANGFAAVPPQAAWVLVHDAARPCLSRRLLDEAVRAAKRHGAVACGLPASLTVKAVDARRTVRLTLDRDSLWFVQTPQVFRRDWFGEALARAPRGLAQFPDDAAVVESAGFPVCMVPGDPLNIKVTTKEDLWLAEAILKSRNGAISHQPSAVSKRRHRTSRAVRLIAER
ncbi:MAG: 2-C-methyl-D-erythritol 4-phosphate cytidylyltransferase [Candidatus Omnitrophica bacterium]|nr:2-C-methyl-D-erythritol 4-phosphate cytidylyltransferase [Candidatus Omnitrophota bacterium]